MQSSVTNNVQQLNACTQGAQLMAKYGVNVPRGVPVFALDQVDAAVKQMTNESGEVVVKSQILAGGRGLGTFKNGFQGGVHIVKASDAKDVASKMLGQVQWVVYY